MTNNSKTVSTTQFLNREYLFIWLVALIGITVSLLSFFILNQQVKEQAEQEFKWVAHNRNNLIQYSIDRKLELVKDIRDYYQASADINIVQHSQFLQALIQRNSGIEILGLILDRSHKIQQVGEVEWLNLSPNYTLMYVQKDEHHQLPLPKEIIIDELMQLISQSFQDNALVVSERVALQFYNNTYAVMVMIPVDNFTDDVTSNGDFVVAMLNLNALTHSAISYLEPRGVNILIEDEISYGEKQFLAYYPSRLTPTQTAAQIPTQLDINHSVHLSQNIELGMRRWKITAFTNSQFKSAEAFSQGAYFVLFAGLLLTLLLAFYLWRTKQGVAERLMMNQKLRDREQLFSQMTETSDDVFWAMSESKKEFIYISPAVKHIWGIEAEEIYQNPERYINAIEEEDRGQWLKMISPKQWDKESTESIYKVRRSDGSYRWIRDNAFPVYNEDGQIIRLVGIAEDITEKKQADDALRDSEMKLRTIFNQSPDRIMTVDKKGVVILMNSGAALEISDMKSIGVNSSALLPKAYQQEYMNLLKRVFANGEINYLQYTQEEDHTWWEIRMVPVFERDQVQVAMVIATDITEKRQLVSQTIRHARLATIGILSAGIAHEVNNPNNAIQTSASLLSRVWKDTLPVLRNYYQNHGDFSLGGLSFAEEGENLVTLIDELKQNSYRIKSIVQNLRHMGKRDQDDLSIKISINDVIVSAAGILAETINKSTRHWQMQLSDDLPVIRGNFQQLEQVVINIVLNALQSLSDPEQGVSISTRFDVGREAIVFTVIDEGVGIAPDTLEKITEPFYTTRHHSGGTGLGLSISSTIIENHNGIIEFKSSPGNGTRVTVSIPVDKQV